MLELSHWFGTLAASGSSGFFAWEQPFRYIRYSETIVECKMSASRDIVWWRSYNLRLCMHTRPVCLAVSCHRLNPYWASLGQTGPSMADYEDAQFQHVRDGVASRNKHLGSKQADEGSQRRERLHVKPQAKSPCMVLILYSPGRTIENCSGACRSCAS